MRSDNAIKNSITSTISSVIQMVIGFIAQAIFIRLLGTEYLGLNGLFTNVLGMLSFFELGIGSAIVYNLYKPIEENNKERIKTLMNFYKKAYRIIAIIVFVVGLLIMPFLNKIVGETSIQINIHAIYMLYLINSSSSYLLSYKRNLIQANQKSYIVNIVHIAYLILLNVAQLSVLFLTKNYYLYLIIKFTFQILENIVNSYIATKMYPYLNEKCTTNLDKETSNDITKKVKALLVHKIGGIVISSTDNIIISSFLGIATVGLYSSYNTIISSVNSLFNQIILSTTASVGNLLASNETPEKKYKVFDKMRFLNFILACFSAICILSMVTPFIKIWIGEQYVLSMLVTVTLVLNYFQRMQRNIYCVFEDSSGVWYEERFIPIIESILNIVFSIIFLKIFGLAGVFMGTITSSLILWCYSYPKYIYKKIFKRTSVEYARETLGYTILFICLATVTYYITTLITFDNVWKQLISNTLISIIIPNTILMIMFRKTENFKYFMDLLKNIKSKLVKK